MTSHVEMEEIERVTKLSFEGVEDNFDGEVRVGAGVQADGVCECEMSVERGIKLLKGRSVGMKSGRCNWCIGRWRNDV